MCKGIKTVRQFGVELEGYTDENIRDTTLYVDGESDEVAYDCEEDGSLRDGDEECGECDGSGYVWDDVEDDCNNCEGTGHTHAYDSNHNEYEVECRECDGSGTVSEEKEVECRECDGSGSRSDGEYGVEVKSPPLSHTASLHTIYKQLDYHGWTVDDTAGLHVHVDAEDYEGKDFFKLLLMMTAVEPIIYSITDSERYRQSYCFPINKQSPYDTNVKGLVEMVLTKDYNSIHGWDDVRFINDRYCGLNLNSFTKHGTVEFRYFAAQDNAERVEQYVELVTNIVEFAKNAELDHIKVIIDKMFSSNFEESADILSEIFELSYDLKDLKDNKIYDTYGFIRIAGVTDLTAVAV